MTMVVRLPFCVASDAAQLLRSVTDVMCSSGRLAPTTAGGGSGNPHVEALTFALAVAAVDVAASLVAATTPSMTAWLSFVPQSLRATPRVMRRVSDALFRVADLSRLYAPRRAWAPSASASATQAHGCSTRRSFNVSPTEPRYMMHKTRAVVPTR